MPEDPVFSNMSYTYDAEGNLTQRGSGNNYDSLSFQSFGCALKQIQKVRGGSVQETISYGYDGMGQRVKVTDSQGTQYFLYDGLMPVLELDSGKNTTASYVYGANGVIYRRKHLPGNDEYEYHHVNALGSVAIITDDNESVVARYEYDAFGAVRHQWGNSDNIRKFTGKEYDADVKLYYYGARYYDPYIGRFISRDPAADGINWYVYCRNNPLSLVDPTGLKVIEERGVTIRERCALYIVYGPVLGDFLANNIMVKIVTPDEIGGARGKIKPGEDYTIYLSEDYDPTLFTWLGTFVHESVHIWQRFTGLHRGGKAGVDYDYTVDQLTSLELDREEHAQAVRDWFVVTWMFQTGEPTDPFNMAVIPHNLTYQQQMAQAVSRGYSFVPPLGHVKRVVDQDYAPVIVELRVRGIARVNFIMLVSRGFITIP